MDYFPSNTMKWDIQVAINKVNGRYSVKQTTRTIQIATPVQEVNLEEAMRHRNLTATEIQELKEDEEEDRILGTFTPSGFRVPWEDRHYLSTSKHLSSHEKW